MAERSGFKVITHDRDADNKEKAVDTEQKGIAVALNGAVVPRAAWPETALKPGDNVEIVRAKQGG